MAETAEVNESLKTYRGNCHCGAFIFECKSPEIKKASTCDCSICRKKGYLWTFPGEANVTVIKGEGSLTEYTFGSKTLVHKFCPTCGIAVLATNDKYPPGMKLALNVRTFQDVGIWKLETNNFDGKKLDPPYEIPEYSGPEPAADVEGGKIYTGSCHCGAVRACIKVKPLDKTYPGEVFDCNCSICSRGGFIWIYPMEDQIVVQGKENLSYYSFGKKVHGKAFCKICGVYIMADINNLTEDEVAALPDAVREWRATRLNMRPVNLRMLNHFDLDGVKVQRFDGWSIIKPGYVNP